MPRKHKRLLGSRTYCDYTKETLEEALQRVVEGRSTIREASREFKIPFGTLYNKYKGRHGGKPGRQEVFKRLPPVAEENDPTPAVEDALTTLLREQRFGDSGRPQRKKKRLDIPPGCSVSTVAPSNGDQESDDDQLPLTSVETQDRPDSVTSMAAVEEECNIAQTDIYAVDQYILARFSSRRGKKTYKYVCKIIEVGPEITVIGLKSVRNNKRKFKIIADDISEIKDSDIIKILPDPLEVDEDGHLFYVFETDIEVNEM